MLRAFSTEARGWREALSDRVVLTVLWLRALSAALCAAVAVRVADALGAWQGRPGPGPGRPRLQPGLAQDAGTAVTTTLSA